MGWVGQRAWQQFELHTWLPRNAATLKMQRPCVPPCLHTRPPDLPLHPVLTRAADILQYHLVLGESLRARDIEEGETQLETALGKDITVVKKGKAVSVQLVS